MKTAFSRALLVAGILGSAATATVEAAGDPAAGKTKFYTCAGCHNIPGYTNSYPAYPVPMLGGQHAGYIVAALKAYQEQARKHGSMLGNAANMTSTDMDDIAAYVSRFRSGGESRTVTGNIAAGKSKAAACGSCHGEDGNSTDASFPRLAGQYEGYIAKALDDYKSGTRNNPMMAGFAAGLSEEDIHDIAAYYASQKHGLTLPKD